MKLFYVTLNTAEEAKTISLALLEKRLAACTNAFPINSTYRWEGEIRQETEIVLIIKTQDGLREKIEKLIQEHISYTNFIAEITVNSVNSGYLQWLKGEVSCDEAS